MYKIPKDWLRVDQLTGQIQLFPTSGSAGGLIIDARGSLFTPLVQGRFGYAPQMWEVKYKAGMTEPTEEAKKNQMYRKTDITPDLEELIYKKAAASIMTVWGDLIIGAGIANQSISVDGLSQSVGTTQSAMYGGASARVKQLEQDVKRLMTELYNYYNGPTLFAIEGGGLMATNKFMRGRVDLYVKEIYNFVEQRGVLAIWEKATLCSCQVENERETMPDYNCPASHGKGYFYFDP